MKKLLRNDEVELRGPGSILDATCHKYCTTTICDIHAHAGDSSQCLGPHRLSKKTPWKHKHRDFFILKPILFMVSF